MRHAETDAAENLPDGTDPADPAGSFPHIPYYAIGCTLESIEAESDGRMTVEVFEDQSAGGRDMYAVTINALDTPRQQRSYARLERLSRLAWRNPRRAQQQIERADAKVPLFIQGGIHGNEYEGVDASMRFIERLATTPYGTDPLVDDVLDHAVVVYNPIQNPDGRVAGTRTNGNGFDLNRDYITQSQPEAQHSVSLIRRLPFAQVLDQHGYVTPTLVEGDDRAPQPGDRVRHLDEVEPAPPRRQPGGPRERGLRHQPADQQHSATTRGSPTGETLPQGWDDWGPFYTGQYGQLRGLDAQTIEMCTEPSPDARCGINGVPPQAIGRAGALRSQELVVFSSVAFAIENRRELMYDQYEIYRRGVDDAARVRLTSIPPAVIGTPADHDYMTDYPRAHVIPVGNGQRSDAEAKRLVDFLLDNDIEVSRLRRDYRLGGQVFAEGSYVVRTSQALRALANTMLDVGDDISDRVTELYAPPGSWSNGFLWGADVVTIGRGRPFTPATTPITETDEVEGGVRPGNSDWYALEVDSRTAVETINELVGRGRCGPAGHRAVRDQAGRHARRQRAVPVHRQDSAARRRA